MTGVEGQEVVRSWFEHRACGFSDAILLTACCLHSGFDAIS